MRRRRTSRQPRQEAQGAEQTAELLNTRLRHEWMHERTGGQASKLVSEAVQGKATGSGNQL